jgi:hypothetical protein
MGYPVAAPMGEAGASGRSGERPCQERYLVNWFTFSVSGSTLKTCTLASKESD